MILCLVGTNPYDFSRLVKELDNISLELNLKVTVQIGNTKYEPKNCEYFKFKAKEDVKKLLEESELVISQGGFGSMTDSIIMKKKLIAVPRLIEFNESLDNQLELVDYYESKGYLVSCKDIKELKNLIIRALNNEFTFKNYKNEASIKVSDIIKGFLNEF